MEILRGSGVCCGHNTCCFTNNGVAPFSYYYLVAAFVTLRPPLWRYASSVPRREQQVPSNAWDYFEVKKIRDSRLVINSTEAEISTTRLPVESFPKLIGRKSPHPLESAALLSQKDLRNSKTQLVTDEALTSSKGKIQESRSQAGTSLKLRKKQRWHRLQLN